MPEEVEATIDNSDIPFEKALDRVLFDKVTVDLDIESLKKMQGDYGQYWELRGKTASPEPIKDIDGNPHGPGTSITLLLNVPGADASEGQKRAYMGRLAELQTKALGLAKPDATVPMKGVEGKRVGVMLSVYTNTTSGKQKQQIDHFIGATVPA